MTCPHCELPVGADAQFCTHCGTKLLPSCPTCGARASTAARYCGACGARLPPTDSEAAGATPPRASAPAGSFAGRRYQVRRLIGEGARKKVYLAHDTRLRRDVAFALIKTDGLDEAGVSRVRREAEAMGALGDHPGVVTVFDVGDERGQPYIVSQFMPGGSIDDLLQRAPRHRLPVDQVVQLAAQVCRALEHAHARGIIHRDLKPGNVWLAADGTAKLGDFGLAVTPDRARLTVEGMMVGTVAYLAPEQALGRSPDPRSDLYALGAMLYEMVTGRPPFLGDDAVAIISQHLNTPPVAPSWHNPDVPRALEALILHLLAKVPEDRPASAAAVYEALGAIAAAPALAADRVAHEQDNPLDGLAGGAFVGREQAMSDLRAALHETLSGRGRLLLLVGEPGIGKTRTAEELATYARLRNTQVLWGRCYEGDGAPALWPWVQVIRAYVHERDPQALLSEMGTGAADIAQIVSEIRERFPTLPTPPPLSAEQARFRLFDSVSTFLKNAAAAQPLMLVLDDLHWADQSSLLLLEFVARELSHGRLLVVGTYRDVELSRQHPLSHSLGQLAREQLSERIILRGLSERDVARFIEVTAGIEPSPDLVTAVFKETEGNPFFISEVVRLLVTDGRLQNRTAVKTWSIGIPQSVREVVGRRLDYLSQECNAALTVASVIGREFSLIVLEKVSDLSGDRLLDVLDEAVAARVVTEVPRMPGVYRFAHALVHDALYEELTAPRRLRLHRTIAEALEALYGSKPDSHVAEMAYHFLLAAQGGGDSDKAVHYATCAGDRALASLAYEDSAAHYDRALQALELREHGSGARNADAIARRRCELFLRLAEARNRAGGRQSAQEAARQAANLARRFGAVESLARAALELGGPRLVLVEAEAQNRELTDLLEEAEQALGADDSVLRAKVLARLAVELYYSASDERRAYLSLEAVNIARRLDDPVTLGETMIAGHLSIWGPENTEGRLEIANEIIRLGERTGNRELALAGRLWRIVDRLELGQAAPQPDELESLLQLARASRIAISEYYALRLQAMRAVLVGAVEEAEQRVHQTSALGQRVDEAEAAQTFAVQIGAVRWAQGRLLEVEEALQTFAESFPSLPAWSAALAFVKTEVGRATEARAAFERFAAHDFADLSRNAHYLSALGFGAQACAALGDARRAAMLYERLAPFANRNLIIGFGGGCYGSVARPLGLLATTLERWPEAEAHFEAALEMNTKIGATTWIALTQHGYADMLLRRNHTGDRERALALLSRALETAQTRGLTRLVDMCLALKLHAQGQDGVGVKTSIDAVAAAAGRERPDLRRHAAPDGTVTILFSDIEGSTAMTERLGDLRAREILRQHNNIVRGEIARHGGFEVKSQGDGFMVAFQSARRALQCAIAVQRALATKGDLNRVEPLRVRMGLHTGEAIREADDFFGKNVILAARIGNQARGGEILVSSLLKELTESAGDFAFGPAREVELKGLLGRYAVHAVRWAAG